MVERGEILRRGTFCAVVGLVGVVALSVGFEDIEQLISVELQQAVQVAFGDRPYSTALLEQINQFKIDYRSAQVGRHIAQGVCITGGLILMAGGITGTVSSLMEIFNRGNKIVGRDTLGINPSASS